MDQQRITELLERYHSGQCDSKERELLERVFLQHFDNEREAIDPEAKEEVRSRLQTHIRAYKLKRRKSIRMRGIGYAAALLLISGTGFYFWQQALRKGALTVAAIPGIRPAIQAGSNKAVLTLANGKSIVLDSTQSGIVVNAGDVNYKDGTGLSVKEGQMRGLVSAAYARLTTPRGGQYQIILSDGTKVWLNAASSLSYPGRFDGNDRRVQISGEAYFEIAENKTKPFKVICNGQEITVLGTSFNINSYDDEKEIRTTLVSGRIQIKAENKSLKTYAMQFLEPGQQAINTDGQIAVKNVSIDSQLAWRDGNIVFQGSDLESIMRQLGRWYDLRVSYGDNVNKRMQFGGSISRAKPLTDVLSIMQQTGDVHFNVNGREVVVMK